MIILNQYLLFFAIGFVFMTNIFMTNFFIVLSTFLIINFDNF